MPKAKATALRALQIDDNLARALAVLGLVETDYDWDWTAAERDFKRAIEQNPNDAVAHWGYAFLLTALGRHDQAIAEGRHAVELAPLDLTVRIAFSEQFQMAHQYENAINECKKILEIDPAFARAYEDMEWFYEESKQYPEAVRAYQKYLELSGVGADEIARMRRAYQQDGIRGVRRWSLSRDRSMVSFAEDYAILGEPDRAFEYLERAYVERDGDLIWLKSNRNFDNLRSDPRFAALLRRIGLPQPE